MQDINTMKVPDKYEPKNTDEFGTFDAAMTQILSVPSSKIQQQIAKKKARKKRAKKTSERGPSRDSGGEA
jgi:ribosomal protein S17E